MRPSYRILLLSLAVSAGLPASAEGPADASAQEANADTPSRLDSFVRDAIDQGLLKPSTPEEPQAEVEVQPAEPAIAEPAVSAAPEEVAAGPVDLTCPDTDPFDFAPYRDLETYDDLMGWRESTGGGNTPGAAARLARAYLALGLNEEARLEVNGVESSEAEALRQLADLLEGRSAVTAEDFAALEDCSDTADFWAMVAEASSNTTPSAERLEAGLETFRTLPLQMRIEVAARTVPALEAMDEPELAEAYMDSFTAPQVNRSKQLSFNKALLDMDERGAQAEAAMREFVRHPEFQEAAVESLLGHGFKVDRRFQSDVATRLVDEMNTPGAPRDIGGDLDTMLDELEGITDYSLTLQLAAMPATQEPGARDRLAAHFISLVDSDLRSDALMDNLRGMDALVRGDDLVRGREAGERVLAQATSLAVDLGFQHLAEVFASRTEATDDLAAARAALAYRTLNHEALARLLEAHPDNEEIIRLSALSAIRTGDETRLPGLLAKMDPDAETLIALVEMDAASGHWMLPDATYRAAGKLEGEDYQARFARVEALRAKKAPDPAGQTYDMAEIGAALKRARQVLDPQPKEMR